VRRYLYVFTDVILIATKKDGMDVFDVIQVNNPIFFSLFIMFILFPCSSGSLGERPAIAILVMQ
jgi:hypothetical protein